MGVTQCLELSTGNMQCAAMILLAGASLSHSSTDVKVSAHDPKSGLPYSYSITTVDTVPTPANMYGYPGQPYAAPATEEGGESDETLPVVPAPSGYPAFTGYHPYAGLGYAGYPNAGYARYPNTGYAGYPNARYAGYPNTGYAGYPNLGYAGYPNARYAEYPGYAGLPRFGYGGYQGYGYPGYPAGYPVPGPLAAPEAVADSEEN